MYRILLLLLLSQSLFAEKASVSPFEQGKRAFESGNYVRALDLMATATAKAENASARNLAYYYQGLALFELGYFYSSFVSFRNVLLSAEDRNREIYEKAIKNAVTIADKLNLTDSLGKVLSKFPGHLLPSSVITLNHYAVGVYHFFDGDENEAASHLKSVNPESPFYPKALFYLGILSTKKKNHKEAIFYFDKVLQVARGKRELFPIAELARLNLARSYYSSGNIENSIETYAQFMNTSTHWLTVMLEASWPLMRASDTTVSLGNLHTILSPFYRSDLVGEAYVLRATILFSLCKYEEMRRTLAQFFSVYDPIVRAMETESRQLGSNDSYYQAFVSGKGMNPAFLNYAKRDSGIRSDLKVLALLADERANLAQFNRNPQLKHLTQSVMDAEKTIVTEMGETLKKMHKRTLAEALEQREQANYLKVEIVTGEKDLIEGQRGLPPKRIVDVETSVAENYRFWPFVGEYWEDELGTYVYTSESACVN